MDDRPDRWRALLRALLQKKTLLLLLVAVVALLPRLVFQAEWYRLGPWNLPVNDAYEFQTDALRILQDQPVEHIYWKAPGYPYFVAGVYQFLGWFPERVALVQALLGTLTCLLVVLLARRWFTDRWALLAGFACALYGPLIYFEGQLLRPALFTFLLTLWLWVHVQVRDRRAPWLFLASGILLGLAAVVRETALLLLPAVVLWEAFRGRSEGAGPKAEETAPAGRGVRRGNLAGAALLLIGGCLAIAPVTVRNGQVGGEFVPLSTSGGINFYIGNSPAAQRLERIRPGRDWSDLAAMPRREAGIMRPGEASDYFVRKALAYWSREPGEALRNTFRKAVASLSARELPRTLDLYPGRQHSLVFAILAWPLGGFAFPFGLLGPLAMLGVIGALGARREPRFLAFLALVFWLGIVAFYPAARFRAPLVPILAILMVTGLRWLIESVARPPRRFAIPAMLVLCLVIVNGGFVRAHEDPADALFVQAYTQMQQSRPRQAMDLLEQALEANPRHTEALVNLATLTGQRGQVRRAQALAERALAIDSTDAKAWHNLALAKFGQMRVAEGEEDLRRALMFQPDLAEAWPVYLQLLREGGRLEEALTTLRAGTMRWPREPSGWVRTGRVLLDLGRPAEAVEALARARALDPYSATISRLLEEARAAAGGS